MVFAESGQQQQQQQGAVLLAETRLTNGIPVATSVAARPADQEMEEQPFPAADTLQGINDDVLGFLLSDTGNITLSSENNSTGWQSASSTMLDGFDDKEPKVPTFSSDQISHVITLLLSSQSEQLWNGVSLPSSPGIVSLIVCGLPTTLSRMVGEWEKTKAISGMVIVDCRNFIPS
jgi:hypothetical protein